MSTQSQALTFAGRRAPPLPIVGALRNWSIGKTLVAPAVIYAIIVTQLPFVLTVLHQSPDLRGAIVGFDSHRETRGSHIRAVVVVVLDELANLLRQALG
jgi:hypothetical protein